MKDTPLSNCERDFLLRAIAEKKVGLFLEHLQDSSFYEVEIMVILAVDNVST